MGMISSSNGWKYSTVDGNYKPSYTSGSSNPKPENYKENHTKQQRHQAAAASNKKKIFCKNNQRKKKYMSNIEKRGKVIPRVSLQKLWKPKKNFA